MKLFIFLLIINLIVIVIYLVWNLSGEKKISGVSG